MKVILSRKGFDSEYGGCPSPILPDGTMISMPIPDEHGNYRYDDLSTDFGNYMQLWRDLSPNSQYNSTCHLDPDIKKTVRKTPKDWRPAFGQTQSAQTHLENNNISVGDLFLFFGWFKKTELHNGHLCFAKNTDDLHIIYGYLQIGEILKKDDVKKIHWHPHSDERHIFKENGERSNNTIYVAADMLIINGKDTGFPGAGTFDYNEKFVLTKKGLSRSKWKLNDVFNQVSISYHSKNSIKDGYFQSAAKGQEFVFAEDKLVDNWIVELFKK